MSVQRSTRVALVVGAIPVAAAAVLGLWRIDHQGLWPDEAFSARVAQLDLVTLSRVVTTSDSFSALHFGVLHFWQQWGDGEAWLRLPSVAFGVFAVISLFALNARLFGLLPAAVSCALLSFNGFFVRYMQEARSYTLALFFVVLASYCFVLTLERPSARRWLMYTIASAFAIYAHIFSTFVILAHLMSFAWRRDRPPFRHVVGSFLLMAALVFPLAALMFATDPLERPFIPQPGRDSFEWLFLHLTGGGGIASRGTRLLLLAYFVASCAGVLSMVRGALVRKPQPINKTWSYTLMLLWLGVPVLGSFLISFARPILYPRYLIVAIPPLVTISGIGVSALPHSLPRVLALTAFLALATPPLASYYGSSIREGGDWRGASEFVIGERQPGDGILFLSSYGRGPFEYYLQRRKRLDGLVPLYPSQPWGAYTPVLTERHTEPPAVAARNLRGVTRVWALLAWGGFESKAEDGTALKIALEESFTQVAARPFGPSLEVRVYERPRTAHVLHGSSGGVIVDRRVVVGGGTRTVHCTGATMRVGRWYADSGIRVRSLLAGDGRGGRTDAVGGPGRLDEGVRVGS